MTTRVRRLAVILGALGCVALALVLAVEAAAAPASSQSTRKRRTGMATVDQEFLIQPAAWLALRPVWLPPAAAEKPPAAPRLVAQSLDIATRAAATLPPTRGGHGSTGIPKLLPPFPGSPASPIR